MSLEIYIFFIDIHNLIFQHIKHSIFHHDIAVLHINGLMQEKHNSIANALELCIFFH